LFLNRNGGAKTIEASATSSTSLFAILIILNRNLSVQDFSDSEEGNALAANKRQQEECTLAGNSLKRKFEALKAEEKNLAERRTQRKIQQSHAKPVSFLQSELNELDKLKLKKIELEKRIMEKEIKDMELRLGSSVLSGSPCSSGIHSCDVHVFNYDDIVNDSVFFTFF
jgi:hypothetical protein